MRKKTWYVILIALFWGAVTFVPAVMGQAVKTHPGSKPLPETAPEPISEPVAQPKAVFPDSIFEFEPVMEGQEVTHDFIVRNQGEAELLIKRVKPG